VISIIVITYNKLEYSKLCIDSIRKYTKQGTYKIIVIDNCSTDGTIAWLQEQSDLRVILNSVNVGFPTACNQGIIAAGGNDIMLLNNDTIVTPGWLDNLEKCLLSADDIGAAGAVTNNCSNFQTIPCKYDSINQMLNFAREFNRSDPTLWENRKRLVAYCMLIKAEVIKKIGLLDEIFTPGNYEDDDYSVRIRNAGYRLLLCRDTFVHHFGSISFGAQSAQFTLLLQTNKQKFIDKWGFGPHSTPSSNRIEDEELKQWFAYEHNFNYYRQYIDNERCKFNELLDQAEYAFLTGDCEKAMTMIMNSANTAHHSHPGFLTSPRLERLLRRIAATSEVQPAFPMIVVPKAADKRNVLHILSQGYSGGGHTKTVKNWIQMDTCSAHSILITLNSDTTPPELSAAAMESGGWYIALDKVGLSLVQRAKLVRDMANSAADIVVLHIHPHDPVGAVAFAVSSNSPVIFVNHAYHAFSIGMTCADIVVDHGTPAQLITQTIRGIGKSSRLPLPMEAPPKLEEKGIAKETLGIDEKEIVFLTTAKAFRLALCGDYNFKNLLKELCGKYPNATFFVAGIAESGEWAQLKSESNNRIKALGTVNDLRIYQSAADIYLDSLPLGSPEDALASAILGIPVIGLNGVIARQFDSEIASANCQTHFANRDEFYTALDRLVADADYRRETGRRLQVEILQNHHLDWAKSLEQLYSSLPSSHTLSDIPVLEEKPGQSDIIWSYFQHQSGLIHSRFG
jgi:GT2 family glycosyltransferase